MDNGVFKYINLIELHKETKYYVKPDDNIEENTTLVEAGIGCNGINHAMTLTTLYLINDEVVHGEFHHDQILGKCTCSATEKKYHELVDIGGFILTESLHYKKKG